MKKKLMSLFLSMVMMLNMVMLIPFDVFAAETGTTFNYDGYKVDYNITSSWGNNQGIIVTVTNTGTETIENWMLAYDNFNGNIEGIWNAAIAQTDSDVKYVRNVGHNAEFFCNLWLYLV